MNLHLVYSFGQVNLKWTTPWKINMEPTNHPFRKESKSSKPPWLCSTKNLHRGVSPIFLIRVNLKQCGTSMKSLQQRWGRPMPFWRLASWQPGTSPSAIRASSMQTRHPMPLCKWLGMQVKKHKFIYHHGQPDLEFFCSSFFFWWHFFLKSDFHRFIGFSKWKVENRRYRAYQTGGTLDQWIQTR